MESVFVVASDFHADRQDIHVFSSRVNAKKCIEDCRDAGETLDSSITELAVDDWSGVPRPGFLATMGPHGRISVMRTNLRQMPDVGIRSWGSHPFYGSYAKGNTPSAACRRLLTAISEFNDPRDAGAPAE